MVHVTFNEKVECHQYPTQTEAPQNNRNNDENRTDASSSSAGGPIKYTREFLKGLKDAPLSKTVPPFLKKAIEDGQAWTNSGPLPIPNRHFKSVFARPPNTQNSRRNIPQNYVPFFPNNYQSNNYGRFNRADMFEPIEPIGSRYNVQRRNHPNSMPEFAQQRYDQQSTSEPRASNEEETPPEWYIDGPTSMNDCVELEGFPGNLGNHDNHNRNEQLDANISGGPTSAASSNNGSPPAKSTPAKVSFSSDTQRNKRYDAGRQNNWQNNFDNRQQSGGAPLLNDFFRNFAAAQNHSNPRGFTPIQSVQDVESSLLYDRLKFRQMVTQLQTTNLCTNLLYPLNQPVPTASHILSEIDKILQTSNDPVYKRPEVRTLTKQIFESVIPPLNIMNLLKNPLTEPHDRETIQAALKVITQAKQNAAKNMKSHTPTETELRAHIDAIMQDAIIKKRMETLRNELLKSPQQQGGRNYPNQSFFQMFRPNAAGRFDKHSQSDSPRGQCQSFENGTMLAAQESNLNRWFSPTLLNKGLSGELPQIPTTPLRSEELESKFAQKLKGNEKQVK